MAAFRRSACRRVYIMNDCSLSIISIALFQAPSFKSHALNRRWSRHKKQDSDMLDANLMLVDDVTDEELHQIEMDVLQEDNFVEHTEENNKTQPATIDILIYRSKTMITKIEPFEVNIKFLPEISISEFRTHCENVIAENPTVHGSVLLATVAVTITGTGPTGYNRKTLLIADGFQQEDQGQVIFWENSIDLYENLVAAFHNANQRIYSIKNLGVWKNSKPLQFSVSDKTISARVPQGLCYDKLVRAFHEQTKHVDINKELFGKLWISGVNGPFIERVCDQCTGDRFSMRNTKPFCFQCKQSTNFTRMPRLSCPVLAAGVLHKVTLKGEIFGRVFDLKCPFLELLDHDRDRLKEQLLHSQIQGRFAVDGNVIGFEKTID